jgi:hypothetical protein
MKISSVSGSESIEFPSSILRKMLKIKIYDSVFLLALLKHTNKQSTLIAVLLENPILLR